MPFPKLLKRRGKITEFDKAVKAAAQAIKATMPAPTMPGSSWSNQGTTTNALVARLSTNLAQNFGRAPAEVEEALAREGLTWGPPFPPGRPLDPFYGYKRPARTWDFPIGINVQVTPRWGRISFATLKAIIDNYDVASICCRHLINDVRSLSYSIIAEPGAKRSAVAATVDKARHFMAYPDGRLPFRAWLAKYMQDIVRYDAGTLYKRRNEKGEVIALEVVSGQTIIPLVDFWGRPPTTETDKNRTPDIADPFEGDVVPAFLQIIEGMPWGWSVFDDVVYQPWFPLPDSNYGQAPIELILLTANTDIRFQNYFLQFFTQGNVPAGFMEAPEDYSDPAQIEDMQARWDALMRGTQQLLRQIRFVAHGSNFTPFHAEGFQPEFPLYLMRRTAAAYGITPNDLGFTDTVNRATATTQVDVQFRVGTLPLVRHIEDILNNFLRFDLGLKVRLQFDVGQEKEDRLAVAQAHQIYVNMGSESPTEARQSELGLPVDAEMLTPRFVDTRYGLVPLAVIIAAGGQIDAETYAPLAGTVHPVPPDSEFVGFHPLGRPPKTQDMPTAPNPFADAVDIGTGPKRPTSRHTEPPDRALKSLVDQFERLIREAEEAIAQKTGVAAGPAGTVTQGITAETGIQGNPMAEAEDEADAESFRAVKTLLRQWQEHSINRVRRGELPRLFPEVPGILSDPIWKRLEGARTKDAVKAAFQKGFQDAIADERDVGGVALRAKDTGRVLMLQRAYDDTDERPDPASGKWEFPGGHVEDGETTRAGAVREWQEETGQQLPSHAKAVGEWDSVDGVYRGFVYEVPSEGDVDLQSRDGVINPDDPDGDSFEAVAWWEPDEIASNPAVRQEVRSHSVVIQRAVKGQGPPKDRGQGVSAKRRSSPTGVLASS